MGSFIKIDRKIIQWEWWSDINTFRLFIYMLIKAYWKDGNYKGKLIPRGSFPSSVSELSKETNLTENEIRTALKHLKSTGEITSKSTNKFTVFSVKNYDLYQTDNKQDYEQITSQNTNKSQTINEQLTNSILKEYKNIKNIKNNICSNSSSDSDDKKNKQAELEANFKIIYDSYPKKVGKTRGFELYKGWLKGRDIGGKKIKLTNKQMWLAIARYKNELQENETEKQYIKQFDTFMNKPILDYVEEGD